MPSARHSAFSLVEMVAVIAVIAILCLIVVVSAESSVDSSKSTALASSAMAYNNAIASLEAQSSLDYGSFLQVATNCPVTLENNNQDYGGADTRSYCLSTPSSPAPSRISALTTLLNTDLAAVGADGLTHAVDSDYFSSHSFYLVFLETPTTPPKTEGVVFVIQ